MDKIETVLKEKRAEIEKMEAPAEMEDMLKQALQWKRRKLSYRPAAAVLAVILLLSYNFDVLAYYGKKFMGYDQMTIGALGKLNEEGRGQMINKSCTFSNGVTVTIDGIMFDDNELVVFYKLQYSGGKLEEVLNKSFPRLHIYGLKPRGYHSTNGEGRFISDQYMTYIDNMEPLMFYEKWLRIDISMVVDGATEVKSVKFTLDRDRAMEPTARLQLRTEAVVADCRILFDEFTVSAMSSMLKGRIIPQTDEALELFDPGTAERSMETPHLEYDIVSDQGEIAKLSGGQSASGGNIAFNGKFDALPEEFKTLQIQNIRMDSLKLVDKVIDVSTETKDMSVSEDLILNRVYRDGGDLCISVSSRGIPVVGLFHGNEQLEQVNYSEFELEAESNEPVERVFRFRMSAGDADNEADHTSSGAKEDTDAAEGLELDIKYIRYTRISADTVDIPVN